MNAAPLSNIGTMSPARLCEIRMGMERLPDGRQRPRYRRNRFVNLLNRALLDLFNGEFDNLAVAGPPRHGKTALLNEGAAGYFLGTNPTKQVIDTSHSATLASKFGSNVRDMLDEFGGPLFGVKVRDDRRAVDDWGLTDGGEMLSVGVGASLVGHGADLLILDDIIADAKSALSEAIRNAAIDWYESTAETRLNAGAKQILTMQRWHDLDPFARIVLDHPGRWRVIVIPAISDHDPSKGETDALGRAPNEALWPEMWPLEKLLDMQRRKSFWFAAQYQQRPVPRGGGLIQDAWIRDNAVGYIPREVDSRVRWWDRAATEGGGDYTVGVLMSRKGEHYYIEDVVRGQWGSTARDQQIRATCSEDNRRYPNGVATWAEQEPGSAGKDSAQSFEKMLRPYAAHCETSSGSKRVRADSLISAFGAGDVHVCGRYGNQGVVLPDWFDELAAELTVFDFGRHEDQVDACSGAFNKLALAKCDVQDFAWADERSAVALDEVYY